MAIYQGHNEDSSGNILLSIGNGMTATVETGTKASQAYTKGAYLFFNNRLCKASSAISSGATLTIGSNLTQTSLGAEITSHLRSSDGKEFYFDVKNGQYGYYPSASKTASEFVPFGGTVASGIVNVANYNNLVTLDVRDANVCVIVQCSNNTDTPTNGASSITFVYANSTYITSSVDSSNDWSGSLPCANYPAYRQLPAPMSFANSKVTIYPSNSGGYMKWWAFKQ